MHFNDILFVCSAIGFNMSGFIIGCYFTKWYLDKKGKKDMIEEGKCYCPECYHEMGCHSHFCEYCKNRVVEPIEG